MSPEEIANLAYWHLICGESDVKAARLRVMRLVAAMLNELDDCFPDAEPLGRELLEVVR